MMLGALFAPGPARAAGTLTLTWLDCALDPLGAHNRNNPCTSNVSDQTLVCAFSPPAMVDSVLGVDMVLDLQTAADVLPPWWQFEPESCRAGVLQANFDFSGYTSCEDFWFNQVSGGVQAYYPGLPRSLPSQARILVSASVLPDAGYRTLEPGHVYYAAKVVISNAHTIDPGACSGCTTPACVVLNSVKIRRQPGSPYEEPTVYAGANPGDNFATWQGGAVSNCQAVPVRRVTWGSIQSLYR
jgi:hypothetical protein